MAVQRKPRTPREKYGEELRLRRVAAVLTQEGLAEQVVCSPTLISHYEAGRRLPKPDDAQRIDMALATDGFFVRWLEDLESRYADYFAAVAELEREAVEIRQYGAQLVPGLLQTPAYARSVFQSARTNFTQQELDRAVTNRMERGKLLETAGGPVAWTLLDEAVLRRRVGGAQVMAGQLRKVADLAENGRIRLHVVPFATGAHALMEGMLYLLNFEDAAPVAYVEGLYTGNLLDDPALVQACSSDYALALGDAVSHLDSVALVRAIAEEHEHAQD
ncbi:MULTISPECIES: Scr1 family TA system antitoxin-like transcriptional regulator [unclassified Streptomyces]|uniref:helix-turn-helix domain-containing protein n=1 Tax=unclassified Streptomyces TaxID=2593676 RepID=UPI0035D5DBDF